MLGSVSLSAIRAFEAAARHGSFRLAASELHLSPSAVSHAVRQLEDGLGVQLFERDGRSVRLSHDGAALMRHVGQGFDEIRRGLEAVTNRGSMLLRLHVAPSFAAQWLSPRLAGFIRAHPGIELRLAAGTDYARFVTDEYDADIVYGLPRAEGLSVVPLGEETVTPLCTPALAGEIGSIADLLARPLIQSDQKQVPWGDWLAANGVDARVAPVWRFDRSFLALNAACDGLGVALESTRLAEREIAAGRLVAPLAGRAQDVRYIGHRLVYPRAAAIRRPLRLFQAWLLSELGVAGH
jgi:DNA-binding transcriptional LysR family regulator